MNARVIAVLGLISFGCCWANDLEPELRAAITKAIPPIEVASRVSAEKRRCFTCHNQGLPILALIEARELGFKIDGKNLQRQIDHSAAHLKRGKGSYDAGNGQGGKADTAGMALWAMKRGEFEPTDVTDSVVHFLLVWNGDTPHWRPQSDRPPSEGSLFTSTFLALKGIESYGQNKHRKQASSRRSAALNWLIQTEPEETEDAVFRLRALDLLGAPKAEIQNAAQQLLGLQRKDGSWGQQPGMEPDSYSTASALVALIDSKQTKSNDIAYQYGLAYLLKSQLEDGTWKTVSRSDPVQAPYDGGFPHGDDQFISISGSCWAVLAMLKALPKDTN
ncbi:MAG: prenyltransferase/squalene oxidase repeat-containing protein [Verrucomicrobiota bacterium]